MSQSITRQSPAVCSERSASTLLSGSRTHRPRETSQVSIVHALSSSHWRSLSHSTTHSPSRHKPAAPASSSHGEKSSAVMCVHAPSKHVSTVHASSSLHAASSSEVHSGGVSDPLPSADPPVVFIGASVVGVTSMSVVPVASVSDAGPITAESPPHALEINASKTTTRLVMLQSSHESQATSSPSRVAQPRRSGHACAREPARAIPGQVERIRSCGRVTRPP